jgi:hypothetical protein
VGLYITTLVVSFLPRQITFLASLCSLLLSHLPDPDILPVQTYPFLKHFPSQLEPPLRVRLSIRSTMHCTIVKAALITALCGALTKVSSRAVPSTSSGLLIGSSSLEHDLDHTGMTTSLHNFPSSHWEQSNSCCRSDLIVTGVADDGVKRRAFPGGLGRPHLPDIPNSPDLPGTPGPSTPGHIGDPDTTPELDPSLHVGDPVPETPDNPAPRPNQSDDNKENTNNNNGPDSEADPDQPPKAPHDNDLDEGYDVYHDRGDKTLGQMDTAIASGQDTKYKSFDQYTEYASVPAVDKTPLQIDGTVKQYQQLGLDANKKYSEIAVIPQADAWKIGLRFPKNPRNLISQNLYSNEQHTIVAGSNFAKHDPYRPVDEDGKAVPYAGDKNGNKQGMRSSEMMFQNWKGVAGEGTSQLQWVIRQKVTNEGGMRVIDRAYKDLNLDPKQGSVTIKKEDLENDPAKKSLYLAIAGTDNARSTFQMVKDHHAELGNVKGIDITIWSGLGGVAPYSMALELKR